MKIELHTILIKDLVDGFKNNAEEGVVGYGGKLNIRPPFQREFIYNEKQQKEVINSIFKGFPLNVMYWVENAQGTYELLDGQQRTLSICTFYCNELFLSIGDTLRGFYNLLPEQKNTFLNYQLRIYICKEGTAAEQLDWFKIINIAGEKLTDQELRNAIYTGPWITDAKRKFSKTQCVAWKLGEKYMTGKPIRQEYLQTVLRWISKDGDIDSYMAKHQNDVNADREWQYFQRVIAWVKSIFPNYRKEMKGLPWGELYNVHQNDDLSASKLEDEIKRLIKDSEVTNKKGIYAYLLSHDESSLSLRSFPDDIKSEVYEKQNGICAKCGNHFEIEEMEGDHITPWSEGGKTTADNCQMLCKHCNRIKSNK